MSISFGKKHIFTDRSGSSKISINSGIGESLSTDSKLFMTNTDDVSAVSTNGALVLSGGAYFAGSVYATNFYGNVTSTSSSTLLVDQAVSNQDYYLLITKETRGTTLVYDSTSLIFNPLKSLLTIVGASITRETVASSLISNATITSGTIASEVVTNSNITSGTIASSLITNSNITSGTIASGLISNCKVSSGTTTSSLITNGIITSSTISNLVINGTIDSSSTNTGSLVIDGGIGLSKSIHAVQPLGHVTAPSNLTSFAGGAITMTNFWTNTASSQGGMLHNSFGWFVPEDGYYVASAYYNLSSISTATYYEPTFRVNGVDYYGVTIPKSSSTPLVALHATLKLTATNVVTTGLNLSSGTCTVVAADAYYTIYKLI